MLGTCGGLVRGMRVSYLTWVTALLADENGVVLRTVEGKQHTFSKTKLLDAIANVVGSGRLTIVNNTFDAADVDSELADLIVQTAVFGELVYSD